MGSYRALKIADSIKTQVSLIIQGEMADPAVEFVSIEHVELSKDSSHAKIFFTSSQEDPKSVEQALNKACGFIRTRVAQSLNLGHTPTLRFVFDKQLQESYRVDALLTDLLSKRDQDES